MLTHIRVDRELMSLLLDSTVTGNLVLHLGYIVGQLGEGEGTPLSICSFNMDPQLLLKGRQQWANIPRLTGIQQHDGVL